MSVEKQRELEEEEMRRQGRCFHDSVTREGIRSISCLFQGPWGGGEETR